MTKFARRLLSTLGGAFILVVCFLYLSRCPVGEGDEEGGVEGGRQVDVRQAEKLLVQGPDIVIRNGGKLLRGITNTDGNKSDTGEGKEARYQAGSGSGKENGQEYKTDSGERTTNEVVAEARVKGPEDVGKEVIHEGGVFGMAPIRGPHGSNESDHRGLVCDSECERFRNLLEHWPSFKPKAAIYLLTYSSRLKYIKRILSQIDQYFNEQFQYPIIIFHEKDLRELIPTVRGYSKSDIYFQEVYFTLPSFLTKPVVSNIPCTSHISYRHMCRFHAKGIYEEPIMQNLDLVWRLDDDSEILRPIKYDVFQFMNTHNYTYGYVIMHWDARACTTGLWKATDEFIQSRHIQAKFFHSWKEPRLYYNNFEISNLRLWMSRGYKDYIDYLDRLGGIFYHRWGDAPIKDIAVSMFLQQNQTHYFQDIAYRHRSMENLIPDSTS